MKKASSLLLLIAFFAIPVACGSGSSSGDSVAFTLLSPSSNQVADRGDKITFTGTMQNPQDYTYIEFYYDLDEIWDNDNEYLATTVSASEAISTDWDTVSINPGEYHIAVVVYKTGEREITYASITVTILGEELFTLLQPENDITISQDGSLDFSGILRSVDEFTKIEIYLDPDTDWYNSNEELIMEITPATNINQTWQVSGFEVGTFEMVIVLYQGEGGRLIGYIDRRVTIEPQSIPN